MTQQGSAPSPPRPQALEELVHHTSTEVLRQVASDRRLTEDLALVLLGRRDLSHHVLEDLSKNAAVMKSRKVLLGLVRHPHTPRYVSIPIARHLYTFELMQIALTPGIAADVKMSSEAAIVSRLETISAGERLTLAKRASGRVAAALLLDAEERIIHAALLNPQMTEAWIVKALQKDDSPALFVEAVARHPKWSLRREVQIALLRNAQTPLARVLHFARILPTRVLKDALRHTRLSENVRSYLLQELQERENKT